MARDNSINSETGLDNYKYHTYNNSRKHLLTFSMNNSYYVEQASPREKDLIQGLSDLVLDTVLRGASIGFMEDISEEDAI